MTEKTCQQRYVALVNMVFDQEGDLANHFLELFPTPAVFRNMTMEEQDAFLGYDRKRFSLRAALEFIWPDHGSQSSFRRSRAIQTGSELYATARTGLSAAGTASVGLSCDWQPGLLQLA